MFWLKVIFYFFYLGYYPHTLKRKNNNNKDNHVKDCQNKDNDRKHEHNKDHHKKDGEGVFEEEVKENVIPYAEFVSFS